MRITEIVLERETLASIKKDYQAGYDAVDRVINPSRWGEDEKTDTAEPVNKLNLRNAVKLAAAGKTIYLADQQALKKAYAEIKAGRFETRQDSAVLLPALKAAAALQKLTPQQQQILAAFAQEL